MRLFFILCWVALPLLAWAYHVGPGQKHLAADDAAMRLSHASLAADSDQHQKAAQMYAQALAEMPVDDAASEDRLRVQLAMATSQMVSGQLPEARAALESMLDEMESSEAKSQDLVDETRDALASSQYYMTWLMRLEGAPAEQWEPEIDACRQNYRWLAEQSAQVAGDSPSHAKHRHDLEAAIRLARMDLSQLQALKIPSQCQGCCSGQCKKPGKKKRKKTPKKGSGANLGPLPDGSGS